MKQTLENIVHISQEGDCTKIGEHKFYGIGEDQKLGNNMEITYEEKDVEVVPEVLEQKNEDEEIVQEYVPAVIEKRKFVTDITIHKTKEQEQREKEQEIQIINNEFDKKIGDFLKMYPKFEIQTFEVQKLEAEKFKATGGSEYLTHLVETKNKTRVLLGKDPYTEETLAEKILKNASIYESMYQQAMLWKDSEIVKILTKN